jgi:electron-transferring-flavoprotein dehydrogenase
VLRGAGDYQGGLNSLPKQTFPGGLLIGCDAGTLNFAKIKGAHTAMKSGMLAAETVHAALQAGDPGRSDLVAYAAPSGFLAVRRTPSGAQFRAGAAQVRHLSRRCLQLDPAEPVAVAACSSRSRIAAATTQLAPAARCQPIEYARPDGQLTFDRLSSVFVSNTAHEEEQPVHLQLLDSSKAIAINFKEYASPEQRYCPAGVYEIVEEASGPRLQINASNCLHCKTCDIKDPTQNIRWVAPEGGGGPNYPNM